VEGGVEAAAGEEEMIKTFRGLLADGGQDRIRLSTIKGKVGYRIVKFQLFPYKPGWSDFESLVQIFKSSQSSIATTEARCDFTDSDLLAAAIFTATAATPSSPGTQITIFDNEIFNQDVFVTHTQQSGAELINYYLELEVIPLDDAGAEYTTLKDMRQT